MGDREADFYEIFEFATRDDGNPKLLVRAKHNRMVDRPEKYLWDFMDSQKINGTYTIDVPRKKNQPARQSRSVGMAIRYAQVELKRPKNCPAPNMPKTITVWAVLAEEIDPPIGVETISWLLLTSILVNSFEEAVEKVQSRTCA